MTIEPLAPGAVIGIVGGGQLGRMLAQAAAKLGFKASIYAPEGDNPAFEVSAFRHCAPYDEAGALERFAREADAVTYEFENIPATSLAIIEKHSRLAPPRRALEAAQDRLEERRFLTGLDLPCAPYAEVHGAHELPDAWSDLTGGDPHKRLFLKRARFGYDGKGQVVIESRDDLAAAQGWLGGDDALLETGVDFRFEFSVICVRDTAGNFRFYDPPRNIHESGILRESVVPAPLPASARRIASGYARRIADALDYTGVLAVEMFAETRGGAIHPVINEIAPRVHNSGHWTAEACAADQFENHIRAVAGWPLGSGERHSDARMVNLLGEEADDWRRLMEENPARSLTLYGKRRAAPGRKMGHYVDLLPRSEA